MTTLVVRNDLLLCIGNQAALALWASHHAIQRLGELIHADGALAATCGKNRRFIHEICEVCARESW